MTPRPSWRPAPPDGAIATATDEPVHTGVLVAAWFLVDFDLAVLNPLLLPVAHDLHVGLGTTARALTAYLLLFGLMQPVYGLICDAVGRIRTLRLALLAWGVANVLAALAPNAAVLVIGRGVAGACAAAVVPTTAAYVGDRFPLDRLQRTMALLLAAGAIGAATATAVAGSLAQLASWRAAIALVAVAAPGLSFWCRRMSDTGWQRSRLRGSRARISQALASGWLRFLIAFLLVDGAAMVGFYNFFNASLQARGNGILLTGLVTSSYGIAAIIGGLMVRRWHDTVSPAAMFGAGVGLLATGYLLAAFTQDIATILLASVAAGLALAIAQSTAQAWVLHVAPAQARGTATSFAACAVFTGAAAGTAAIGGLAGAYDFRALFLIAAAVSVVVAIVGSLALVRFYSGRHQPAQ